MSSGYRSSGSFFGSLLKWSLLAAFLFLAYENRDALLDSFKGNGTGITEIFNTEARKEAVELTPERKADYFLYVVAPQDAIRRGSAFTLSPEEMQEIRREIIKFESLEPGVGDIGLYLTDMTQTEKDYVRRREQSLKADGADEKHAALRITQELLYRREQANSPAAVPIPLIMIEAEIRNAKCRKEYGSLTDAQAAELAGRYRVKSAEAAQALFSRLDYLTDRDDAWRKGIRGYRIAREFSVRNAEREARNGTIDDAIRLGKEYYEQNRQISFLIPSAGLQTEQPLYG